MIDNSGRKYRVGQTVAYPYIMGAGAKVMARTVLYVDDTSVVVSPNFGASKPQLLNRPHLSMIVELPADDMGNT